MSHYCDPLCKHYKKKDFGNEVKTVTDVQKEMIDKYKNKSSLQFDLEKFWDIGGSHLFEETQLVILIADTGVGKTAWLQNLIVNLAGYKCLYITLEVHNQLLYRRFCQIALDMTKEEVINAHLNESDSLGHFKERLSHITMQHTAPRIDTFKELVAQEQPDIVVIDTIDKVQVPYCNDPFKQAEKVTQGLKQIAVDTGTIIFGVSHVSRGALKDKNGNVKH